MPEFQEEVLDSLPGQLFILVTGYTKPVEIIIKLMKTII
jgi:hypothetical protein